MPKVSVIVPVFNTEKFLQACIDSLLAQTFGDFQLVLVNDGSTDGSGEICARNAAKDPRITFIDMPNLGVSAARNAGIDAASGEWICFVDSDDTVSSDYLQAMLSAAECGADFVILEDLHYHGQNRKTLRYLKSEYQSFAGIIRETRCFSDASGGACAKLFSARLLNAHNLRFLGKNAAYEDTVFTFCYLFRCSKIAVAKSGRYIYNTLVEGSLSKAQKPYSDFEKTAVHALGYCDFFICDDPQTKKIAVSKWLDVYIYAVFAAFKGGAPARERRALLGRVKAAINARPGLFEAYGKKSALVAFAARRLPPWLADTALKALFGLAEILKRARK